MAKGHKPRAGSRAYWPKKRARRIYPRLKAKSKEPKPLGFAAYKAGMSQAVLVDTKKGSVTQGEEVVRPVTILDCPAVRVCGIKAYKSTPNGLADMGIVWSEKISKELKRKTRLPKSPPKKNVTDLEKELENVAEIRLLVHTKPRESGIRKKTPELFELPLGGDVRQQLEYAKSKLGGEIKVADVFAEGDSIDVIAVTKGKGYQGPVKRFGIRIRPRKHEKKRRHVGNLGPVTPGRVLPGKIAMAGQLGFQTRTEWNKKILKIGNGGIAPKGGFLNYGLVRGDYLVLEGSVPGPKKRLIMLRPGLRAPKTKEPVQFKEILLHSQQGT